MHSSALSTLSDVQIRVTRFEQTGRVFDLGTQNAVIIIFVCLCLAASTVAFFLYATAPLQDDTTRRGQVQARVVPLVIVGAVAAAFAAFFATHFYRSSVFPQPHPTSQVIMAQSVRTATQKALHTTYPGPMSFDTGSDLAVDSANLRSATPRTYTVTFHMTTDSRSWRCAGTAHIGPQTTNDRVTGQRDQLNPHTGEPDNAYAPVTVAAQCN